MNQSNSSKETTISIVFICTNFQCKSQDLHCLFKQGSTLSIQTLIPVFAFLKKEQFTEDPKEFTVVHMSNTQEHHLIMINVL